MSKTTTTTTTTTVTVTVTNLTLQVSTVSTHPFIRSVHPKTASDAGNVENKAIFTDISTQFEAGQVTAIMGGSGSGKTSLLEVVLGRVDSAHSKALKITGQVLYNCHPLSATTKKTLGYVAQHDMLLPYLTVRETLSFAADLKLENASSMSSASKAALVDKVMQELGLAQVGDVIIGDELQRGISGGEKRRVSVGVQLVTNPSVLFLDGSHRLRISFNCLEPTTGLDAFTAFNLIQTLSTIAKSGPTVVISIHQPRADIFQLLDKIVLLSNGRLVYSGSSSDVYTHFEALGFKCPGNVNLADFIIDVSSIDLRDAVAEASSRQQVSALVDAWSGNQKIESQPVAAIEKLLQPPLKTSFATSVKELLYSTKTLTHRTVINIMRDRLSTWGNLFESCLLAVIIGYLFFQIPVSLAGMRSRAGAAYSTIGLQPYLLLILNVYRLCEDIKIFDRERRDGMYSVFAFLTGHFSASVIPLTFVYCVYASILYFMFGFRLDSYGIYYGRFLAINLLHYWSGVAMAWFCVSVSRRFSTASLVANSMISFLTFTSGFFINTESLPVYVSWIRYVSSFWYSYRAILSSELSGRTFNCPLSNPDTNPGCLQYSGDYFLSTQGSFANDFWVPVWRMLLIWSFWGVATFVVLNLYVPHSTATYSGKTFNKKASRLLEKSVVEKDVAKIEDGGHAFDVRVKNVSVALKNTNWVTRKTTEKILLTSINVVFPSGKVNVILGGSGAGKSTLLNAIAGRLSHSFGNKSSFTGSIDAFTGADCFIINQTFRKTHLAYVTQGDNRLLPSLTVRETLHYAAQLRLSSDMNTSQKIARAEEIILLLGLKECADKLVGGEAIRGVSGGEKRRLSVGVQLLQNPSILLLDEPTSGLDAYSAHGVMTMLKQLSQGLLFGKRCTIICTIHQPRSDIYLLFDTALLLVAGGKSVYSGSREQMISYLEQFGQKCPQLTNPADFALDVSMIDYRSTEQESESKERVHRLVESYQSNQEENSVEVSPSTLKRSNDKRNSLLHLPILVRRSYQNLFRQMPLIISRISQVVAFGAILTLHFAPLQHNLESVQTRYGVIQEHLAVVFLGLLNNLAVYPQERNNFYMEHEEGVLSVASFQLTYLLSEIPFEIISAMIFVAITDVLGGLQMSASIFFVNSFICLTLVNVGESIGIVFCTIFEHVGIAVSFTNVALSLMGMMSGIFSLDMPALFNALNYVVPTWYAARIMVHEEFESSPIYFTCQPDQKIPTAQGLVCPIQNGQDALSAYKFDSSYSMDVNLIAIAALMVAYRLGAYLFMLYRRS